MLRIYRHLKQDLGFHEVGFAPVTTSPDRLYAINERGMDGVLEQFHMLADEYLEYALRGEMHGFSNVSDTLAELYQGVNKSHPCGAALGLMGVGPSGDIAPCHRFVDSDTHALGHISTGIDREKQSDFLTRGHINAKYDCHTCWARPLCAGGCHHEAFVRYGDTGPSESALLRLDSRLDRYLSAHLRRDQRAKPGVPGTVCRKEGTHETYASR